METAVKILHYSLMLYFFPLKTDDCSVVLVAGDLEPSDYQAGESNNKYTNIIFEIKTQHFNVISNTLP